MVMSLRSFRPQHTDSPMHASQALAGQRKTPLWIEPRTRNTASTPSGLSSMSIGARPPSAGWRTRIQASNQAAVSSEAASGRVDWLAISRTLSCSRAIAADICPVFPPSLVFSIVVLVTRSWLRCLACRGRIEQILRLCRDSTVVVATGCAPSRGIARVEDLQLELPSLEGGQHPPEFLP